MEEIKDPLLIANPHGYYEGGEYPETSPAVRSSAFQANTAVAEPLPAAARPRAAGDWHTSQHRQTLELGDPAAANSVTSAAKDSMIVEPAILQQQRTEEGKEIRRQHKGDKGIPYAYKELAQGGNLVAKIIEQAKTAHPSRGIIMIKNTPCWVRRLSERELFRLMDVDENDIDTLLNAGISNTQLAKLAGNSIVTACMYHIFHALFIETTPPPNTQTQLF